jgi:hypothetical protein
MCWLVHFNLIWYNVFMVVSMHLLSSLFFLADIHISIQQSRPISFAMQKEIHCAENNRMFLFCFHLKCSHICISSSSYLTETYTSQNLIHYVLPYTIYMWNCSSVGGMCCNFFNIKLSYLCLWVPVCVLCCDFLIGIICY